MSLFTYLLQSSIALVALYAVYFLVLRNLASFTFNRFYLVSAIVGSLLIPFINIEIPSEYSFFLPVYQLQTVFVSASGTTAENQHSIQYYLMFLFCIVSFVFLINYLWHLACIIIKIRNNKREKSNGIFLIETNRNEAFSFFYFIFLYKQLTTAEKQHILFHEQIHARQWHSLDKLLVELWLVVQWFNPFAWLVRKELSALHEYAVDRAILQHGHNRIDYQEILLNKLFGTSNVRFIQYFNHSLLKKRIMMMSKNNEEKSVRPRLLLAGTLALAIVAGFSFKSVIQQNVVNNIAINDSTKNSKVQNVQTLPPPPPPVPKKSEMAPPPPPPPPSAAHYDGEVFVVVENIAKFQNGDVNDFRLWVQKNIKYPAEAKAKKLEGKEIAQFIIDPNGKLVDVTIVRGVDPILDNEVVRILFQSPSWTPATQGGKKVAQQFIIPVNFSR